MNNYYRYFVFFLILLIASCFVGYNSGLVGNSYGYLLLVSLLLPAVTFPFYKRRTQNISQRTTKEYKYASLYAKIGFVAFAIAGFIYASSQNFCAHTSSSSWCYDLVPELAYALYGSFIGILLGAIIGVIQDISSSKK